MLAACNNLKLMFLFAVLEEQTKKKLQSLEENVQQLRNNFLKRRPPLSSASEHRRGITVLVNDEGC